MSSLSFKSDKCAILRETVNQICRIKQESEQSDELQQSEVSSSKPTIVANDVLGLLLLEALDGFFFVVNTDGKIEFVSENVTSFLKYHQDDLVGKSIYNIIHLGDHARFSSNLLPMSIGNGLAWTSDLCLGSSKSRTFNCRFLIKPPDDQDETMEEKQTRVPQYENTQISAVSLPCHGDKPDSSETVSELQNCLVCVARRLPATEKNCSIVVEQFDTRLDLTGKILSIDTSRVSSTYSQYLNKDLVGKIIQEICYPADLPKVNQHLKETLQTGSNTSGIYRFRVTPEKYIFIQSKSKLFGSGQRSNDKELIMATHSIISDSSRSLESTPLNSNNSSGQLQQGGGSAVSSRLSPDPSSSTASSSSNNLNNLVNLNGVTTSMSGSSMASSSSVATFTAFNALSPQAHDFSSFNDLALDIFPSSSWDLGGSNAGAPAANGLPDHNFLTTSSSGAGQIAVASMITTTSGSQQQPSSSAFSPDQFRTPSSPCSSPVTQLSSTSSPGGVSVGQGFTTVYPFSPIAPSSGKSSPLHKEDSYRSDSRSPATSLLPDSQSTNMTPSTSTTGMRATQKLRDLLTQGMEEVNSSKMDSMDSTPTSSAASETEVGRFCLVSRSENTILRELLNQEDEDNIEFSGASKMAQKMGEGVKVRQQSSSTLGSLTENCRNDLSLDKKNIASNNMLRKLLNNEDEGDKSFRKSQDLLQQLLKAESPEKMSMDPSSSGGSPPRQGRDMMAFQSQQQQQSHQPQQLQQQQQQQLGQVVVKRKSSDDPADSGSGESAPKRPVTNPGQGRALLAGQNPMLASMLAQTPRTLPSVPTSIANSIISQLPQERLPKNLDKKLIHTPLPGGGTAVLPANLQQLLGQASTQVSVASSISAPPVLASPSSNPVTTMASANSVMGAGPPAQGSTRQQACNRNVLPSASLQQQQDMVAEVRSQLIQSQQQPFSQQQQQQGFLSKILSGVDISTQQQLARFQQRVGLVSQAAQQQEQQQQQQLNLPELLGDGSSAADSSAGGSNLTQSSDPLLSEILDQVWSMQQDLNLEAPISSSSSNPSLAPSSCTSEEAALLRYLDEVLEPHMQAAAAAASSTPASPSPRTPSSVSRGNSTQSPSISSSASSQDINERLAINAIQRQLMSFEVPVPSGSNALPVYNQDQRQRMAVPAGPGGLGYPYQGQPPAYSNTLVPGQRPQRMQSAAGMVTGAAASNSLTIQRVGGLLQQYGAIAANVSPQMRRSLLERRQQLFLQAQQNKKRLMAQQQQQQLTMQTQQPPMADSLGPPNASQGLYTENMNELLNNTVAPNVTLQRTTSLPDHPQQQQPAQSQPPQLSPRYSAGGMISHTQQLPSPQPPPAPSQLSPGQRALSQSPFSPLPQSFPSPTPPAPNQGYPGPVQGSQQHRLSPHSFPNYPGKGPSSSPISSGGGPRSPHLSQLSPQPSTSSAASQWTPRGAPPSPAASASLQQQQNPMLNAQLSQSSYAAAAAAAASAQARFAGPPAQAQRQLSNRSLPSPAPGSRSSPYSTQPDSPYHMPPSPGMVYSSSPAPSASQQALTSQTAQVTTQQQQQQQQRIQRVLSMPGRVNSPRTSQAGAFLASPVVTAGTAGGPPEPLLSPQPSPGNFSQSVSCAPAISSTFNIGSQHVQKSQQGAPVYTVAQENSHFSFEQQMFPQTTSNDRNRAAGNSVSSEFVKQELRAMVGARTQQQQLVQGQVSSQHLQQQKQQQQQQQHTLTLNAPTPPSLSNSANQSMDLDVLAGLQLDLVAGDGQPGSPSLFSQQQNQQSLLSIANSHEVTLSGQMHTTNASRVEEVKANDQKKSLLQQLLSEPS